MRVTQNSTANNALYNIQQLSNKLDSLQESISSQQNVNRPSDDPISIGTMLDIGDRLKALDQYSTNITKANTWVKFTDTTLTGISDILLQTKNLFSAINSGSNDPNMRQSAHDQLVDLKKQIIEMANMQMGDQYILGGAKSNVAPFTQKTGDLNGSTTVANIDVSTLTAGMEVSGTGIPANTTITAVTAGPPSSITLSNAATANATGSTLNFYAGDSTQLTIEIARATTQAVGLTGDRVLKGASTPAGTLPDYGSIDILQTFDNLIASVGDKNTASNVPNLAQAGIDLYAGSVQISNAIGDNIARMVRLDNMTKLNDLNKNMMKTIMGNIQEVDNAQLGMELSKQKIAYEASLAATAKISELSLLKYLP
jgi:flagellar hook-associated protein 3 FlgL